MTREPSQICGVCQSTFVSGDCVHIRGRGTTDDPFVPEIAVDPDEGNLFECGPNGLAAFLPAIYQDPPACNVYATINFPVGWDAAQSLIFNEVVYDTDGMFSVEEDPGRITIKTPGVYLFTLNVRWNRTRDNGATGDLAAFLIKNGTDLICIDSFPMVGGDSYAKHSIAREEPMAAGDYMSTLVKQDITGSDGDENRLNLAVTAERKQPCFTATFLRPIEGMTVIGMDTEE